MDISVTQENLHKALSAANRVTTSRGGLPILANILLRVQGTQLLIAATNLELASASYIGAKVDAPGEITVPARLISEYVANLPKDTIHIITKNNSITLTCAGYTSTIHGMATDDFPELPEISEAASVTYDISTAEFKRAITQTTFATSSDASRPVLTGAYWHTHDKNLYIVATDGYRLAEKRLIAAQSDVQAIIPTSTLQEVYRLLSDDIESVEILIDETQVRFRLGSTEITSRLIDGKFPDYRQLIPAKNDTTIIIDKVELTRTTKIAAIFSRDTGGSITVDADHDANEVQIRSTTSDVGENNTTIAADITTDGSITLNSRYLNEALAVIDEPRVNVEFSGKLSPITITPTAEDGDYLHIIMPLKS